MLTFPAASQWRSLDAQTALPSRTILSATFLMSLTAFTQAMAALLSLEL